MLLLEVGNESDPEPAIVGAVVFDGSVQYEGEDDWEQDAENHLVAVDDLRFAWRSGASKFGWRISEVRRFEHRIPMDQIPMDREYRSIFRLGTPFDLTAALPAPVRDEEGEIKGPTIDVATKLEIQGAKMVEWKCEQYQQRLDAPFPNSGLDIAGYVASGTARLVLGQEERLIGKGDTFVLQKSDAYGLDVLTGITCLLTYLPRSPKASRL